MSDAEVCRLEAIELEEDDLELFPDAIVQAYKSGRTGPRKAYGMLRKHVRRESNAKRRERQAHWLTQRRVWAVEGGKPAQFTFNGFGTRMYGTRDIDLDDGSYISTLYFVVLFIPLLPLTSYWVTNADGGGLWIHGSVPHPKGAWTPAIIPAGITALGMAGCFASLLSLGGSTDVHLHNGFDRAVTVTIADRPYVVAPRSNDRISLDNEVDLTATAAFSDDGDGPFETVTLPLASSSGGWSDDLVYNIGGRSLLFLEYVVYGRGDPDPGFLLTDQVSRVDDIDYAFREPPEEIRTKSSRVQKTWLSEVEPDLPRMRAVYGLLENGSPDAALAMARSELLVGRSDTEVLGMVVGLSYPDGVIPDEFCEELLAKPDVDRHRFCQNLDRRDDPEGVLAHYRALADEHPDSAMHQYLLGRLLPGDEAVEAFHRALELDPNYARAHFAMAWDHLLRGKDAEVALEHLQAAKQPGVVIDGLRDIEARLLQATGMPASEIAERLSDIDDSAYTLADMYALKGDRSLYQSHIDRMDGFDYRPDEVANTKANIALIAGELDDLRRFNAQGAGLELFLALSEGATDEDRAFEDLLEPSPIETRMMLYEWLFARLHGRDGSAWKALIEAQEPALMALLEQPDALTEAKLRAALVESHPSTHAGAWFVAWRLTGDARYGRLAREIALPSELPWFEG